LKVALIITIIFAALGVLIFLYALLFRRRAMAIGPQGLLAALSRTVREDGEAGEDELLGGAAELEARLQRALYAVGTLLIAILVACVVLTAMSILPELSLALSGFSLFLISLALCIILLRDIPRQISRHLGDQDAFPGD
jgi:hypothetical protein